MATMKLYHPIFIKLINHFGSKGGFTLMLSEMLDGQNGSKEKEKQTDGHDQQQQQQSPERDGDDHDDEQKMDKQTSGNPSDATNVTTQRTPDRPPSTLTHHSLQCYIHMMAYMFRFFNLEIKQTIANYMFQV